MTGIRKDRAVFHFGKIFFCNDIGAAGDSDEEISDLGCLFHRHHLEAVHDCLDGSDRVDFGDDHLTAKAFRPHCAAFAAPAVSGDHDILAGNDQVRGAVDAVKYGLACAITVVKEMLAVCLVDHDHRELQFFFCCHRFQPDDARGGLFASADQPVGIFPASSPQEIDQVSSVVDDQMRMAG